MSSDSRGVQRVENWGEYRRALSYGIVWGARAPPNDSRIERAPTLATGLEVQGCSCFRLLSSVNDLGLALRLVKFYLKLKMLRVKIPLKNDTGFAFTVE